MIIIETIKTKGDGEGEGEGEGEKVEVKIEEEEKFERTVNSGHFFIHVVVIYTIQHSYLLYKFAMLPIRIKFVIRNLRYQLIVNAMPRSFSSLTLSSRPSSIDTPISNPSSLKCVPCSAIFSESIHCIMIAFLCCHMKYR